MAFRDLDEFLTVKPLVLPIGGKEYAFPGEISARSLLLLSSVNTKALQAQEDGADPSTEVVSDEDEAALRDEIFGGAEAEMIADGLTNTHIRVTFFTLIAFHMYGLESAQTFWNAQGEAPAPNRAARRHSPKKSARATAKSARSRGSRAGTTSAKTETPDPATPGSTSLSAGT